jgi:hypothetical protein
MRKIQMSKLLRSLLAGFYAGMPHVVEEGAGGSDSDSVRVDPDTGETVGTGNDARLALMNQIADNNDEERSDELANVNDDDTTEPFKAEKTKSDVDDETIEGSDEQRDTPNPTDKPETKKYKIKVNGRELELSEEELIARAQKVESADEYLRSAKQQVAPKKEEAPKGPTPEELQQQENEELLRAARAIQMGSEEEAVAALQKIVQKASSVRPSMTTDDVSRTIDERLAFNTAIEHFSEQYEDIWTNPTLKGLAFQRDAALIKEGDTRPYAERYAAIGEEIRAWKADLVKASAPKADEKTDEQTKLERKASAPKAPAAASAKAKPAPREEDDIDDSPSAVIANMAKSRGGPQWMRN